MKTLLINLFFFINLTIYAQCNIYENLRGDGMLVRSVDNELVHSMDSIEFYVNMYTVNNQFFINFTIQYPSKQKGSKYDHDVSLIFENGDIKMIQYISTNFRNKQTSLQYLFEIPQSTLDEIIKSKVYHFQFTHDGSNVMVLPFKNPNVLQQMYDCLKHN